MIGTTEIILIAGIALLFFGGKKLPELMRGMGRGMRIFREEMNTPSQPADTHTDDPPATDKNNAEASASHDTNADSPNATPAGAATPQSTESKPEAKHTDPS